MRKILIGTVLAAAMMLVVGTAQAGKPGGSSSKPGSSSSSKPSGQSKKSDSFAKKSDGSMKKGDSSMKKSDNGKHSGNAKNFLSSKGTKFSHGFYYCGKGCDHWSHCCFWSRYNCDCYYCPYATCWYYWCEPRVCYLPVSCVEFAPPVTEVVNVINSPGAIVSQGAPSDLPPVLPSGPAGAGPVQPFKAGPVK